jgi:hypothetical protein
MPGKPIWSHDATGSFSYAILLTSMGFASSAAAITAIRLTGQEATVMDVTGIADTHKRFICGAVNAGTLECDVIMQTKNAVGSAIALPQAGDNNPASIQFLLGTVSGDPNEQIPDITISGYIQSVSVSAERDDVVRATVIFRCTGSTIHTSTS